MESVRRGRGVCGPGEEMESSSEEEIESKQQRGRGLDSSLEDGVSNRRFLLRWAMDRGSLPSCSDSASENVSKERFLLPWAGGRR